MRFARTGLIIVVLAAVAMAAWYYVPGKQDDDTEIVISPKVGPFKVSVTTTGELRAKNSIKIRGPRNVPATGIYQLNIADIVPEGTLVMKGDFVAQLDKSDLSGKLKDLRLNIQKAESQYEQAQLDSALNLSQARDNLINLDYSAEEAKLRKEQSVYEAPSVRRQAEIDYEKAERSLKQARKNYQTQVKQAIAKMREVEAELRSHEQKLTVFQDLIEEFTVRAPADGMVIYSREYGGRKRVVGSVVSAWNPVVATLPDLSEMESFTYINEIDIQHVIVGQIVQVGLDALPDKRLTGIVKEVANVGEKRQNSDSKVFEVVIGINEKDTTLRPSMTTSNDILVSEIESAVFIPLESIQVQDSVTFVYKQTPNGTVKQQIELGLINENEAIVERGINSDDAIYLSTPPDADQLGFVLLGDNQQERRELEAGL